MTRLAAWICLSLLLWGCERPEPTPPPMQILEGRELTSENTRLPLYRARIPERWHKVELHPTTSTADTTVPIGRWTIDQEITITVHTFPFRQLEQRITPRAQVARWKQQFSRIDQLSVQVQDAAWGGFSGLMFQGTGTLQGREQTMIAWSMHLFPAHAKRVMLQRPDSPLLADYTIKAVGPCHKMRLCLPEIIAFAQSFHLAEELSG